MATGSLRASAVLAAFFGLTVPLMPVQAVLLRVSDKAARRFPHWYHRQVCRILGITLKIEGAVVRRRAGAARLQSYVLARHPGAVGVGAGFVRRQDGGWRLALRLGAGAAAALRLRRSHAAPSDGRRCQRDHGAARAGRYHRALRGRHLQRRQPGAALQDVAVRAPSIGQDAQPAAARRADAAVVYTQRPRHPGDARRPAPASAGTAIWR